MAEKCIAHYTSMCSLNIFSKQFSVRLVLTDELSEQGRYLEKMFQTEETPSSTASKRSYNKYMLVIWGNLKIENP